MIDITDSELFKDLTSFEYKNYIIDLHNDYECTSVEYLMEEGIFKLIFEPRPKNIAFKNIIISFDQANIAKATLNFKRTIDASTINIFYRGRFELEGNLYEFTTIKKSYWYIEFEQGDKIELYAFKVSINCV